MWKLTRLLAQRRTQRLDYNEQKIFCRKHHICFCPLQTPGSSTASFLMFEGVNVRFRILTRMIGTY